MVAPAAQQPAPAPPAVQQPGGALLNPTRLAVAADQDANETRQLLRRVLEQYPPTVTQIIALDPSLLGNAAFMAAYPQLTAFVAEHPQVTRNPGYYFGRVIETDPQRQAWEMWEDFLVGAMVFIIVASVAAFLGWLLKMFMDHRRWLHVSRVQTEAHNKLLDRLSGHEELLTYIQSPSGRRFLESAPVLEPSSRGATAAPFGRVLWSVQIGAVLLLAGIGLLIAADMIAVIQAPLLLVGVLAMALGIGFGISAWSAYALSRRFGLLEQRTDA
jgi:hypothetical protein